MVCNCTDPCFFEMLAGEKPVCQKTDISDSCLETFCHGAIVSCKEKDSCAYYVSNPGKLAAAVVRIDKYVIKDDKGQNYNKCDYALLIENPEQKRIAILVELKKPRKNSQKKHAMKQILDTLDALEATLSQFDKVYGRIVTPENPKKAPSDKQLYLNDYRTLSKRLKAHGGDLEYRNPKGSAPVDSVAVENGGIILKKCN